MTTVSPPGGDRLLLGFEFHLSSQSTLPGIPLLGGPPQFDKVVHAAYFLVGLLAVRVARFLEECTPRQTAWTLLPVGLGWGPLDGFHQAFVPGRYVEAGDAVAVVAGAVLAGERLWRFFRLHRVGR